MNQKNYFSLQRRVVSHMTTKSWADIPHVTYLYEPDITEFIQEYLSLVNEKSQAGRKLTLNTIILRTIIEGLKVAPQLNAAVSYNAKKGEGWLKVFDKINICLPWILSNGSMITPVLENAESKNLDELIDEVNRLADKINNTNVDELLYQAAFSDTVEELRRHNLGIFRRIIASKISFHPLRGLSGKAKKQYYNIPVKDRITEDNLLKGTVTVSNIGSLYKGLKGQFGLLEIIPPQVFSIGVGAVQEKPGVYLSETGEKLIGIRKTLPMCLAFDHRAVDFSALIPFLKTLDGIFIKPELIRNW